MTHVIDKSDTSPGAQGAPRPGKGNGFMRVARQAEGHWPGMFRRSYIGRFAPCRLGRAVAAAAALALCGAGAPAALPAPAAAAECPNAVFRTGPSANLPDCRAYELVSPPLKNNGLPFLEALSPDGSSALLHVRGGSGVPGAEGMEGIDALPTTWISVKRTGTGWTYMADNPPSSGYGAVGNQYFGSSGFEGRSLDGETTVWSDRARSRPANSAGFYLRRPDHSMVEVGPSVPPTTPLLDTVILGSTVEPLVAGLSADASHLLYTLREYYWPSDGTSSTRRSLYEYVGTGNTAPMLVGVNDRGEQIGQCGDELGNGAREGSVHNALSKDGSTAFFTVLPQGEGCESASTASVAELFARIDSGLPDARTVSISEPSKEDCAACNTEAGVLADAHFQGASEDGTKVFFKTAQPLLPGAVGQNLYEYDFDAPAGERLVLVSPAAGDPGLLRPITVVSEDGSHAYFLASGVLTTASNGEGEAAEAGADNLYVFERDARYPAGRLAFVARLSDEDLILNWLDFSAAGGDATPDGQFFVFASERDLTPDTTSHGVSQVFEYDAQTGGLVRVSIGQDGYNHNGNAAPLYRCCNNLYNNLDNATIARPNYGLSSAQGYWQGVSVSANGAYVFFQSAVGLTPQALDRKLIGVSSENEPDEFHAPIYASNVYEYHAGRVSLISDGLDLSRNIIYSDVALLSTNESGSDVFFSTGDSLLAQDTDDNVDIYDARVDGGFPSSAMSSCSGEECQGALSGAPTLLSPGSEFQAGGNPPLAPVVGSKPAAKSTSACKRGTIRRSGRCVKARGKRVTRSAKKRRGRRVTRSAKKRRGRRVTRSAKKRRAL
jgi:hypothetical protein